MELKSFIEKIMLVNDTLGYSDNTERLINHDYYLKDNSQTLEELEKLIIDSIKYSQSPELKLGLEIMLLLLSHKNENIRNSALAKMFVLMDDGLIRELVVKELKNVSSNGDVDSSESAEYSLDLIAEEIHRFELVDAFFDMFCKLKNRVLFKVSQFEFIHVYSFDKQSPDDMFENIIKNRIFQNSTLFNKLLCKLRALNRKIDRMVPYLEEIENYDEIEYKELNCLNTQNSKSSEKESLQKLAEFYAATFTERGHLRRLIFLLDDEDYEIQQIGFNALVDIMGVLLNDSAEKKFVKPLSNSDLEKISPFKN